MSSAENVNPHLASPSTSSSEPPQEVAAPASSPPPDLAVQKQIILAFLDTMSPKAAKGKAAAEKLITGPDDGVFVGQAMYWNNVLSGIKWLRHAVRAFKGIK